MANVMIVDDAIFMRTMIKRIIIKQGHAVIAEAGNGIDAVEKYKVYKPDLVLLDFTMPELDGIETLRKIKEYDNNAKVIMCSAMGQQHIVIDAIRAGALDFIIKPFQEEKVVSVINRVL